MSYISSAYGRQWVGGACLATKKLTCPPRDITAIAAAAGPQAKTHSHTYALSHYFSAFVV